MTRETVFLFVVIFICRGKSVECLAKKKNKIKAPKTEFCDRERERRNESISAAIGDESIASGMLQHENIIEITKCQKRASDESM